METMTAPAIKDRLLGMARTEIPELSTLYAVLDHPDSDGTNLLDLYAIHHNRPEKVNRLVAAVLDLHVASDGRLIVPDPGGYIPAAVGDRLGLTLHGNPLSVRVVTL